MSTALVELAKRLPEHFEQWCPYLVAAELCYGVDPYYLAAILEQETDGGIAHGYHPKGAAGWGDQGHGHGLFQIDDRSHGSFLDANFDDGTPIWKDPAFQAMYAARLLRKNLDAAKGDYFVAVAAYNCGLRRAKEAVRALGPNASIEAQKKALDARTARGNYLSKVIARRNSFFQASLA